MKINDNIPHSTKEIEKELVKLIKKVDKITYGN